MFGKHIAVHEQHGYNPRTHVKCSDAVRLYGPVVHRLRKVIWEPLAGLSSLRSLHSSLLHSLALLDGRAHVYDTTILKMYAT